MCADQLHWLAGSMAYVELAVILELRQIADRLNALIKQLRR